MSPDTENSVRNATRGLNAILDRVRDPVFLLDAQRRVLFGNRSFETWFPNGSGEGWIRSIDPRDQEAVLTAYDSACEGNDTALNARIGPEARWFELRWVRMEEGAGILGLAHDVQAWMEREQHLAEREQSRKMEALGNLAGHVAHEFTNMVGGIASISGYVLGKLGPDDRFREEWQVMHRAAERSILLTRDLLALAGQNLLKREQVDLSALLWEAVEEFRKVSPDIRFELETHCQPIVSGSGAQLHQLLRNLFLNAVAALRRQAGQGAVPRVVCRLRCEPHDQGELAVLEVEDNGPGFPPGVRERVFEPFFSARGDGRGNGLGLAVCYGIAQQHRGILSAHDAIGGGALFRLSIPLLEKSGETGA